MPNRTIHMNDFLTGQDVPLVAVDNGDGTFSLVAAAAIEGTALASQARTAQQNSADIANAGCRGIMVFLNVTAASGTGGLTLRIQGKDPVSGTYGNLLSASAAVIATGMSIYIIYPGGSSGGTQGVSGPLPKTWRISMNVGDATSYTYSVGYCLLP